MKIDRSHNLLIRTVLLVLFGSVLLVIFSNIFVFATATRAYRTEIEATHDHTLNLLRSDVDGIVAGIEQISSVLYNNINVQTFLTMSSSDVVSREGWRFCKQINEFLFYLQPSGIDSIVVLAKKSGYAISSRQGVVPISQHAKLADIAAGFAESGGARYESAIGSSLIRYTIPIGVDSAPGIVAIEVSRSTLDRLVRTYFSRSVYDHVVFKGTDPVYRFNDEVELLDLEEYREAAASGSRGGGTIHFVVPSWIGDWTYVTILELDAFWNQVDRLRRTLSLIILMSVVAAVLVSLFLSSLLYEPINTMVSIIEHPNLWSELAGQVATERLGELRLVVETVKNSNTRAEHLERELANRLNALRRAHARVLQEQIRPHFLYNSIQTITWLVLDNEKERPTGEAPRVLEALGALGELVRNTIDTRVQFTSLEKEILFLDDYVKLMTTRFPDQFVLRYRIGDGARSCSLPKMILQPLVENAIIHGIQPSGEKGTVEVSAFVDSEILHLAVTNDGTIPTTVQINRLNDQLRANDLFSDRHVGLHNVDQRMKLLYGNDRGVRIVGDDRTLRVELTLPCQEFPPHSADDR